MIPPQSTVRRMPGLRPRHSSARLIFSHRPPLSRPHPFTHKPQQQSFVSQTPFRPQLPFLSQTQGRLPLAIHLRQHFIRLINTNRREQYKRGLFRGLKIALTSYAIIFMLYLIDTGIYQEEIEHRWPTPPEWSWKSRWALRSAIALQHPNESGQVVTQWHNVYGYVKELLERLEDPNIDGKEIQEPDEGEIFIDGVGRAGFDVSTKSEPWRRGYFQALMSAAKAAENLEGFMTDSKQRVTAKAEYVHGPSNPNAKTLPGRTNTVMHEEDCTPAAPPAETFYMKILTTTGFTAKQKIDAALAYADYLDFKGLGTTAGDMYTWAMDIAASGLSYEASRVVDTTTGVLKNNGQDAASDNLLRVSTALAVHNAKIGDLSTALAIFTSVLKARRSLPGSAPPKPSQSNLERGNLPFDNFVQKIKNMFVPPVYPSAPSDGNAPPVRQLGSPCEEAGLMTYIGEILYATSSRETGLAWTRDAVDIAESELLDIARQTETLDMRDRCSQCLKVGIQNWRTMVHNLVTSARVAEEEAVAQSGKAWFGGASKAAKKTSERKRWEAEEMIIDDRSERMLRLTNDYSVYKPRGGLFS
jgi:hypothetical protein